MDTGMFWILVLLAALFVGPWLFGRATTSVARNTVFKKDNERALAISDRLVRIEVPGVSPAELIRAIVGEADFPTEKGLRSAVYIADWDDEHIVFDFGRIAHVGPPPFTAVLVATTNDAGDGLIAEYGVAQLHEFDGQIVGMDQMEQTERTIRQFVTWKFPEAKVTV